MKRISLIIVLAMIINAGSVFGGKKGNPFVVVSVLQADAEESDADVNPGE